MTKLSGKDLWDEIERRAKKKFKLDDSFELRAVDLIDNEIAYVRLKGNKGAIKGTKEGYIIYA